MGWTRTSVVRWSARTTGFRRRDRTLKDPLSTQSRLSVTWFGCLRADISGRTRSLAFLNPMLRTDARSGLTALVWSAPFGALFATTRRGGDEDSSSQAI